MHTYAIGGKKSGIRISVITVLLVISIILSTLINLGIKGLANTIPSVFNGINTFLENWSFLDFSIGNISAFLIFGLLMLWFDKRIWMMPIVNRLIGVPNFSGVWEGTLVSSYDPQEEIKVRMTITQTWTDISVLTEFINPKTNEKSESGSDSAFVNPEYHLGKLLKFTYANTALVAEWEQSEHRGQNELILKEYDTSKKQFMVLEGTYFNNRGRTGNKGTITMRRISL